MRRRAFITALCSAAIWPIAAHCQKSVPSIGLLGGGTPEGFEAVAAGFRESLRESGFIEGSNVTFEYRWARGQFEQLPRLATELVNRKPAVIATQTLPAALAAKAATGAIPIVFVIGEDPVEVGLVASLNRPGGNVTGISNFMNLLAAKRLELVTEILRKNAVVGLLVNPSNPNTSPDIRDLQTAAEALGRRLEVLRASSEQEIETAFATAIERKVGALIVNTDPYFYAERERLVALAARHSVPTIYPFREMVIAGGLISYGASFPRAWRQSGIYVAKILRGVKPDELPVLQPTTLELVINIKTAKALDLALPPALLARADEVIE